ncbi:MAG: hypothetical protein EOO40_12300 [Deltaproteobacteria bacterium]|nr:MAG: hypothetical protein EOO40_12300 [Deltaproteobacteria bacterium]
MRLAELRAAPAPLARRAAALWLRRLGLTQVAQRWVRAMCEDEAPLVGAWRLGEARLRCDAGLLWQLPQTQHSWAPRPLTLGRDLFFAASGYRLICALRQLAAGELMQTASEGRESVAFDADRLHFKLCIRPWRQGDKLRPFGLNGHVKVGDLFTDAKVPRALRPVWPVVTHGEEIAWVVGLRRSQLAPLTSCTQRVCTIKVTRNDPALLRGSAQ